MIADVAVTRWMQSRGWDIEQLRTQVRVHGLQSVAAVVHSGVTGPVYALRLAGRLPAN